MSKESVDKSEVAVSTPPVAADGDNGAADGDNGAVGSDKAAAGKEDPQQLQEPVPEKRQRLSPRNDNIQLKDTRKVHFQAVIDDADKKARGKRRGPPIEDRSNLENDFNRGERMKINKPLRKRSHSFSEGGHAKHLPPSIHVGGNQPKNSAVPMRRWKSGRLIGGGVKGRGGAGNVLPSEFLLGGNIHDPLNLNSLSDEKLRMVSSLTPESSPLPTPKRKLEDKIEVLIPPNISDPLNLNAGGNDKDFAAKLISPLSKKKKVRHRNRTKKRFPALDISKLPGPTPKEGEGEGEEEPEKGEIEEEEVKKIKEEGEKKKEEIKVAKVKVEVKKEPEKKNGNRFVNGNYNRYYGYRNPGQQEDPRIKHFKSEWFQEKRVLDIGCNIGHVTISIGKLFKPVRMVGVDIDKELIRIARKNIRHYMDTRPNKKTRYPRSARRSFGKQFGPMNPSGLDSKGERIKEFPHNVEFYCNNYVPETDQLLEIVQQEFDSILCLSTTKWMHLNTGDAGLKRAFKKMYAQLKPGGMLILEAQSYSNYGKRKNLSENILKNFKEIKFRPEQFAEFLLTEVGFTRCEVVAVPSHSSKGFQRPLQLFIKGASESEPASSSTTPCSYGISPHYNNPAFTPFYGKFTPGSAYTPSESQREPAEETDKRPDTSTSAEFLYPGPSHLYSGPTPGGYSANSTPSGYTPGTTPHGGRYSANSTPSHLPTQYRGPNKLPVYTGPTGLSFPSPGNLVSSPVYGLLPGVASPQTEEPSTSTTLAPHNTPAPLPPSPSPPSISSEDQTPSYTPQYTPSYTPAHPGHHSQGNTPVYSGPPMSPSGGPSSPLYSPGNATPLVSYSPSQYSPEAIGPGYSPSALGANYSPDTGGANYSPDTVSGGVAYSPAQPNYSPDTMRPSTHSVGGSGVLGAGVGGVGEPSYSPDTVGPGYSPSGPAYSPSGPYSPAYSPSSGPGMISSPQNYSPSFQHSPAPAYSPHSPAYSPNSPAPAYSPAPNYSPGNATPLCTRSPFPSPNTVPLSTRSPMPSPSIQAPEISGNTTPHPGPSESPLSSSPRPHRYSWSGANLSGRNTPIDPQNQDERTTSLSNPQSNDAKPSSTDSNPPSVDAKPSSVDSNPPSVDANPPSVDAKPSSIDSNPPSVEANPPSVDANPSSVERNPLSVEANPPSVDANPSSVDSNPPSVDAKPSSIDSNPPSVDAKPPSVDSNPPSVEANLPSIEANPLSVDANPPSVDAKPSSTDSKPSSVEANLSIIEANPQSADAKPSSIDSNPPSVDAIPPNVEANPSIINTNPTRINANPHSINANTPNVKSNPPRIEANPSSIISKHFSLDLNPPSENAKPLSVEANSVSVNANPPVVEVNPTSICTKPSTIVSNPHSADIDKNPPSVETNPPSVHENPPIVDLNLPGIDAKPDSMDTNPPNVEDKLASIESNPLSVEANPTSPTLDVNSLSVNDNKKCVELNPLSDNAKPLNTNTNLPCIDGNQSKQNTKIIDSTPLKIDDLKTTSSDNLEKVGDTCHPKVCEKDDDSLDKVKDECDSNKEKVVSSSETGTKDLSSQLFIDKNLDDGQEDLKQSKEANDDKHESNTCNYSSENTNKDTPKVKEEVFTGEVSMEDSTDDDLTGGALVMLEDSQDPDDPMIDATQDNIFSDASKQECIKDDPMSDTIEDGGLLDSELSKNPDPTVDCGEDDPMLAFEDTDRNIERGTADAKEDVSGDNIVKWTDSIADANAET